MNSIVKVFSNFREFYSEINAATLTGAIDVIVVEQPDGEFQCSPFHVRFGKIGVLRSREKIVDIEINGEPADIHMKLGDSGEAFFVEECPEEDIDALPANLATSPIQSEFQSYETNEIDTLPESILPLPRRNSIDFPRENNESNEKDFENQISDLRNRRHTENSMQRPDLSIQKIEFTTQKLRQQWAEHEEEERRLQVETSTEKCDVLCDISKNNDPLSTQNIAALISSSENIIRNKNAGNKEDFKLKKKRSRKSRMKKNKTYKTFSNKSNEDDVTFEKKDTDDPTEIEASANVCESFQGKLSKDEEVNTNDDLKSPKTQSSFTNSTKLSRSISTISEKIISSDNRIRDLEIHFFSDSEITTGFNDSRPSTPIQSDSELEILQREAGHSEEITNSASWKWGELPNQDKEERDDQKSQRISLLSGMFNFMRKNNKIRKNAEGEMYLSDLNTEGMDPKIAALYLPTMNKSREMSKTEDDFESGTGTSLPHSPSSYEGRKSLDSDYEERKFCDKYFEYLSLSTCGGLEKGGPTEEEFNQNLITYSDICRNPSLYFSPKLVVRLNDKYYDWSTACSVVMTAVTFKKPLPNDAIEQIDITKPMKEDANKSAPVDITVSSSDTKRPGYSWWHWRRSEKLDTNTTANENECFEKYEDQIPKTSKLENMNNFDNSLEQNGLTNDKTERYRKTLRLSSELIKSLNLKNGMNEIQFSVTTAYQGTSRCKCYLFRWKYNDKVVISDIDGTITKSDVLGHILPMVGKDWAQIGVAKLFSKIEENGYKLLYLSARAIGQSHATREYLRSIRQGDVKLPDGPLLLNPTSLISAFHREVIERKPEQFKIACLSDIQALFPHKDPFYAGYGNRINDVWAYRAVGIPTMRIFTINTKGELKHELTQTFQSSYCSMTCIVDQLFPPIKDDEGFIEFSNFNYWREPIMEMKKDSNSKNPETPEKKAPYSTNRDNSL